MLMTVKTGEEAIEITGAYLQYYRETAAYLERTAPWLERLGLEHIKAVLEDAKTRNELNARLDKTLERYIEPWKEAIEKAEIKDKYYQTRKVTVE